MSLITRDGVYLVTNVAYPTHYLISDPRPAATNNALQCWRLEQDPQTSRWTMRAIVSHYAQHLNYRGEGSSYLCVGDDSGQRTAVVDEKTWLTLQPIRSEEQIYYRIENARKKLVVGVEVAPGERSFPLRSLPCSEDIFLMSRQFWEFKLMPGP